MFWGFLLCARVLGRGKRKGKNILMQPCQSVVMEFIFQPHPLCRLGYYYKIHFHSSMRLQANKTGGTRRRKTGYSFPLGHFCYCIFNTRPGNSNGLAGAFVEEQTLLYIITWKYSHCKLIKKLFTSQLCMTLVYSFHLASDSSHPPH